MSGPVIIQDLECPCDRKTKQFRQVVKLRYHPNLGLHPQTDGYQCVACGEAVSTAAMINASTLRRKQQELSELQAEVDSAARP